MVRALRPLALLAVALLAACSGGDGGPAGDGPGEPTPEVRENVDVTLPTVTYAWDPKAGDPAVPAELGGPGFTGEGWETRLTFQSVGDPKAIQGGTMVIDMPDWPATLRMAGKDWNTSFNYFAAELMFEGLLTLDPITLEFIPRLATHWQISEDKSTYRFRINPAARWSDGTEITAADVVATYRLKTDPTLLDPSSVMTYGKLEEPKAISKYIVEVKVKEENWRNFLYFATSSVFPGHQIGGLKGSEYLDKYQFAYTAVSGPYHVLPEDIDTGNAITLTRRTDWWDDANPVHDGTYNIGKFKFVIVKDPQLRFEKIKKGEIDYMIVPKAQWWAEDIPKLEQVQRGLLVPRKFFTEAPIGTSGLALNQQRPPLDDKNVRLALQHLYDRETMIEKLFFDEYEPLTSYYQGGVYANPGNQLLPYDELAAVELLEKAGWTEINSEGYRVKDGKVLSFALTYGSPLSERSLTVFQESAKKAGIKIDLQLLTPASGWKNVREKQFDIHDMAWGALIFPNPETSWHSRLADQKDNNNITGFKNERVDALCAEYDKEYDVKRRIEIIREIDGILYQEHPYVLGWFGPSQRVLFWNKFDMPAWGTSRYGEADNMFNVWWIDPAKEQALEAAKKDPAAKLDAGPREVRFWPQWAEKHGGKSDAAAGGEE